MMTLKLTSRSPDDTSALGQVLGSAAASGTCLDLRGTLGVGKTHMTRAIAAALGVPHGVASPTFTVCHVHEGEPTLYHLDAYRLTDPQELLLQGWDEWCDHGVVVVEWGERIAEILPEDRLEVCFEHESDQRRSIELVAHGPAAGRMLALVRDSEIGENLSNS